MDENKERIELIVNSINQCIDILSKVEPMVGKLAITTPIESLTKNTLQYKLKGILSELGDYKNRLHGKHNNMQKF